MSGYFARLMSQTGIGGTGAPPSRSARTPPLAIEEVLTQVAQPEPLVRAEAVEPFSTPSQPDAPEQQAGVTRAPGPAPGTTSSRAPAAADAAGRRVDLPVVEQTFDEPSVPEPDTRSRPTRAAPVASDRVSADEPGFRAMAAPGFGARAASPLPPAESPAAAPVFELPPMRVGATRSGTADAATRDEAAGASKAAPPLAARADPLPSDDPRERSMADLEATMPQQPSRRSPIVPHGGAQVRIGSIQVDVHAPPPPVPPPAPIAPPPPSTRATSLRRFYLRYW